MDRISLKYKLYKTFTIEQKCCYWIKLKNKKTMYLLGKPQQFSIVVVLKGSGGNTVELFLFQSGKKIIFSSFF